jgi:predicted heme/steroid binding protein
LRLKGVCYDVGTVYQAVDWNMFDFVGVDHYKVKKIEQQYVDMLKPFLKLPKPVLITEFGFRTYQGAESSSEGMAGDIVDHKTELLHRLPVLGRLVTPKIRGTHIRDENSQAKALVNQLTILDNVGVHWAFVSTFVSPLAYYNSDPRYDLDMASYSLVKSYPGGIHGVTYSDMSWELKNSSKQWLTITKNIDVIPSNKKGGMRVTPPSEGANPGSNRFGPGGLPYCHR